MGVGAAVSLSDEMVPPRGWSGGRREARGRKGDIKASKRCERRGREAGRVEASAAESVGDEVGQPGSRTSRRQGGEGGTTRKTASACSRIAKAIPRGRHRRRATESGCMAIG